MPRPPCMNAQEAEAMLLQAGFVLLRSKGSHRIYRKDAVRIVIPFHGGRDLHPKIAREVIEAVEPAS